LAKEDVKNGPIKIMNLLQCSWSSENKGRLKAIYMFKLWMFSSFKLVLCKPYCAAQREDASHFSTHQAVKPGTHYPHVT
jgi:hypothetical protein